MIGDLKVDEHSLMLFFSITYEILVVAINGFFVKTSKRDSHFGCFMKYGVASFKECQIQEGTRSST